MINLGSDYKLPSIRPLTRITMKISFLNALAFFNVILNEDPTKRQCVIDEVYFKAYLLDQRGTLLGQALEISSAIALVSPPTSNEL